MCTEACRDNTGRQARWRTVLLLQVHAYWEHAAQDVSQAVAQLLDEGLQHGARLGHAHDARGANDVGAVVKVVDTARVDDLLALHVRAPHAAHHASAPALLNSNSDTRNKGVMFRLRNAFLRQACAQLLEACDPW